MESSKIIMFSYLPESLDLFSKKKDQQISGPFKDITINSYFSHNQEYIERVEKLISKDWKLKNSLSPLMNLMGDVSNGNEIKKSRKYMGAKKIIFSKYDRLLSYNGKTTPNCSLRSLENMCIERVCQYAAVDETFREEASKKLSNDLLKNLSQYPRFPRAAKFIDDLIENNADPEIVFALPDLFDRIDRIENSIISLFLSIKNVLPSKKIKFKKTEAIANDNNIFDVEKTDNADEINEKENDYKKEVCALLKDACSFINQPCMNAGEIKLQNKIKSYVSQIKISYNKKKIGKLFNAIFSLHFDEKREKIKNEWEKKVFSHLLTVIFDRKVKPQDMLHEAVTWLVNYRENKSIGLLKDYGFWHYHKFYSWIIDDSFQKYPLYATNTLANLAVTAKYLGLKEEALGIIALYGPVQRVVDYNPLIIHEAIKNDNIKALMLFEKYGTDFSDSAFINTALQSKSFACLSFLFDKQKNMLSQYDKDHIWKMVCDRCENIENIYDQKYYKALWRAKLTGDICKLEKFIIKNFTCVDAIRHNSKDDQKRQEINQKLTQLYTSGYSYWNNETTQLKAINDINNVATTLLSAPLRLLQKDKNFLPGLLSMVQKTKVKMDNYKQLKDIKSDIKNVVADKKFILFCLNTIAFWTAMAINNRDFTVPGLLVLGGFGTVAGVFFKLNYSKYYRIKRGISLCAQVDRLEGLLKGLQGEKEYNNLELQEKSLDVDISRAEVLKIFSTFTLASMIGTHNGIFVIGGLVAALYSLFKSGWEASSLKPSSYINNEDNARSKKLDELLANYLEQGKVDGFARISNLKKQYKNNKFLKKNNKQNKNIIDNNLFFQLLQYGKFMQERKFKLLEKFDYFESNYAETYQNLIKHYQEL